MKAMSATVLGLALLSAVTPAMAQPYGGRDYGSDRGDYGSRDRGYGGRERERDYGDRDDRDYDRGPRGSRGGQQRGDYAFDEQEYLRCNPDVRKAVVDGRVPSGLFHYRKVGRTEGRKLSC